MSAYASPALGVPIIPDDAEHARPDGEAQMEIEVGVLIARIRACRPCLDPDTAVTAALLWFTEQILTAAENP